MKNKKLIKITKIGIIIFLVMILIPFIINLYVIFSTTSHIYENKDVFEVYDYALVLGCGLKKDGTPSLMLRDRLNKVIELYNNGKIKNIIISGEHNKSYSEVNAMEKYLIENNIPGGVILRDEEGSSTSESIVNYYNNYKDNNVIIITQKYHLYRALFIANKLKLNAIGVSAKEVRYYGQLYRDIREILARCKDFVLFI